MGTHDGHACHHEEETREQKPQPAKLHSRDQACHPVELLLCQA